MYRTDDPLLIEVGRIYREWVEDNLTHSDLALDIQDAITPYLSRPENAAKGLPTNIGYEQTPEQKRRAVSKPLVKPTRVIVADEVSAEFDNPDVFAE